jgi:hypothetical protein
LPHPLEDEYGLTAQELLDAVNQRFRAKVALEGVVAEAQFERKLRTFKEAGTIADYRMYDKDDYPDFSIRILEGGPEYMVEVKNIRDAKEAYKTGGEVVAYKVELQKTRRGADPSSRYYDVDRFDIVAVCLGKKTGDWGEFFYAMTADLTRSSKYPDKLDIMHRVPLPESVAPSSASGRDTGPWYADFEGFLTALRGGSA